MYKRILFGVVAAFASVNVLAYDLPGVEKHQQDYEKARSILQDEYHIGDQDFLTAGELRIAKSLMMGEHTFEERPFGYLDDVLRNTLQPVKGTEYAKAYADNELRAEQQFEGKRLLVKGYINNISRDIMGKPYLALNGSGTFQSTLARFEDNEENLNYLADQSKKTIVELVCTGAGFGAMNAILADCQPYQRFHDAIASGLSSDLIAENNRASDVLAQYIVSVKHGFDFYTTATYSFVAKMASEGGVDCERVGYECFMQVESLESFDQFSLEELVRSLSKDT